MAGMPEEKTTPFVPSRSALGQHAVVIGGGIAGLLAARVLLNHFDQVSLIERDNYPDEPVARAGIPQGNHLHMLFLRGQEILEGFFPGMRDKLIVQGALEGDFADDYIYCFQSGWLPRTPSQLRGYVCTRLLLEWQIRQELQKYQRIKMVQGHEVVGLIASSTRESIIGVRLRERSKGLTTEIHDLNADLVVDASGRFSRAPQWLEESGYQAPMETVVNAFQGYATRVYAPPVDATRTWKGMLIQGNPPKNLRTGFIWSVEGGRWLVLLVGTGKDYPPTQESEFVEFARGLADPLLYETIRDAVPLSPIYSYRRTENRLRHFERLKRYPERFIVMGDAYCALNPIYGQGMTVAALGAEALDEWLSRKHASDLRGLSHGFQKRLAHINAPCWQFALSSDYRVPAVEGKEVNLATKLQNRYMDSLVHLLPIDKAVRDAFMEVFHLRKSPTTLMRPGFLLKSLMVSVREK
jgi:2-polyprenyl-6-methoxyphenol hydroxylase-like FAD-dependent oxidoreductase